MAIAPHCDFCTEELTDFGGLLFSPPDAEGRADKFHVCQECYRTLTAQMKKPR